MPFPAHRSGGLSGWHSTRLPGAHSIEDFGRDELNARYFSHRADGLRLRGGLGRVISAEI